VNTLQLHSDQVHLLSSASDGTVAVWDVRQLAQTSSSSKPKACKPVASGQHFKSSQGAYWEPGGGRRVLSISFDDTLRIWDMQQAKLTQQVRESEWARGVTWVRGSEGGHINNEGLC
jgi:WD40 repeat protein